MPTYQYRCTECGQDLEVVQKFSDASLTVCPHCQGALRKVFNAVGVVFKGSGFYRTDSRSGGSDTSSSIPAEKKTESTPAAKTEAKSESSSSTTSPAAPPSTSSTGKAAAAH